MSALDVLPLGEAKQHLNMSAAATTHDVELVGFITAAVEVVGRHLGEVLYPRQVAQTVTFRDGGFVLDVLPVTSITSATAESGTVLDLGDLRVDPATGIVATRGDHRWARPRGREVTVIYQAGYVAVPPHYRLAVAMVVAELWRTQRVALGRRTPEEDAMPQRGLLPLPALQLLGPRPPVIA